MTIELCACHTPLRDTSSPTRRFHCARCTGVTPYGRRLSLEETARLVATAHSILDRLLSDLTYANQAVYGLHERPCGEGAPPRGSHSDPTLGAVTARQEALQFMALAAQWVRQATSWLINADEAAGLALQKTDPHRGVPDHVKAPHHDTFPTGNPGLTAALNAQARRRARGEL